MQMASVCTEWNIPFLNLSDVPNPTDIPLKLDELQPKIILASIEDISNATIQSKLQSADVQYVAIDECQVKYFAPVLVSLVAYFETF